MQPSCEEALAGTDRFLVEVKVKPNNVIEVYVDSDTAVNIDHCAELSRFINEKLDRDVEDYELSVLSWGLSGALKMDRQLQKYVGKDVEVKTKETGKMQGKLVSFDAEKVEFNDALNHCTRLIEAASSKIAQMAGVDSYHGSRVSSQ